ncbi:MAG: AAA family ATPase [Candidatus Eremiobacteraeota bacterium]|nr:AAA family ATPase [Candidatus Eremiobacteraeota bacterium]
MAVLMSVITPKKFIDMFKARTDRLMLYSRGKQVSQQIKRGEYELIHRSEAHIGGSVRMGFYNMMDDFTVPWAVVVFEEGGESKNTARDSALLVRELNKLGLRGVRRERGMLKGENYKVWIFLDPPVLAKKIRYFLFTLFEKLGFSKEIPIIPTADELSPGDTGQHVWLPYFNGVDKWLDEKGEPYEGMGIKQEHAIFIGDKGNAIENDFLSVAPANERDIDQALTAITSTLAAKYMPGVGLIVNEDSAKCLLTNCAAFQKITSEIESTGRITDEGLLFLGAFLRSLGQEELWNHYTGKMIDFKKKKFERKLAQFKGGVFPNCLNMKQIDYCPPSKICFSKTAPLTERYGFWKEDKKGEKTQEPTPANWLFKSISESTPAQAAAEGEGMEGGVPFLDAPEMGTMRSAPKIKISVKSMSDFMQKYGEELDNKRKEFTTKKKELSGLNSGFEVLNEFLDGLVPGSLILLSGMPGSGKTGFAKQMLDQVIDKEKLPCIFVSYEQSKEELHRKTLARMSGITYKQIRRGALSDAEFAKIDKVNKYLKEKFGDLTYIMEADENINVDGIKQAVDKSEAKFAVVDNLQVMPVPARAGIDPLMQMTANLTGLKRVCREKDIAMLVIFNGKIPPEIEYNTDVILKLTSNANPQVHSSEKQPYVVYLNVEKNREGISKVRIQYTFFPPRMTFYGEKKADYKPVK